jgi:hypothetical protein
MTFLDYLIARLREASSYAGLVGMLLGGLHIAASPDLVNAALGLVAALGGLLAVLIPEQTTAATPAVAAAAAAVARGFLPALIAGGLALGLSACAGGASPGPAGQPPATNATNPPAGAASEDPLKGIAGFVTADLQNALQIAKGSNDTAAVQCYQYLIPQVTAAQQQLGALSPADISGGFSAFEAGRVAVTNIKGFVNGVPQGLNQACAPLVLDAGSTLVGLAAKVGVTIALPGAGALLPAL